MDRSTAQGRPAITRLNHWLAAGIPYLGPLIALGGLLLALAFAFGGPDITESASQKLASGSWTEPGTWAALLLKCGDSTLDLLPAALSAYVAYGIADRPALAPGVVGGVAVLSIQAGFIGGVAVGVIAGVVSRVLGRVAVPSALRGISAGVLVPLVSTLVTASVTIGLIGHRLAALQFWFTQLLTRLEFHDTVALGLVLGLMTCADLGGAISKSALSFGIVSISSDHPITLNMTIMASVMAAGMVPALGLALATAVRRSRFSAAERQHAQTAWLLGIAFVPEGAIPFALTDPLRVLPATMAGGAVTGALTMVFGSTTPIPYGGLFIAGHLGKPLLLVVAVAAGVLVTAATAVGLKSLRRRPTPALVRKSAHHTTPARTGFARGRVRTRQGL